MPFNSSPSIDNGITPKILSKIFFGAFGVLLSTICSFCNAETAKEISAKNTNIDTKKSKVLVSKFVDHPALDKTAEGIVCALEKNGYKDGKNLEIRVESAQANAAMASQIASKFEKQKPDVVIAIGTVSSQAFIKSTRDRGIKLVFSSVTDPIGAGLVKNLNNPGGNISGVSNYVDLKPQIELFKKIQPSLKKLGFLYNPGEANSVNILEKLKVACKNMEIELIEQAATKTSEVAQSAVALAEKSDAIFISNDNTALSSLSGVIKAANNAEKPVYVSDTDAIEQGAVAALGPNQFEVGVQTGNMVSRVLSGSSIGKEKVEFPNKMELYLNLKAAKKIGMKIPKEIIKSANKIFE